MPILNRTRPSFTSSPPLTRDSFDLPDYYRSTRLEKYGPYYRTSEPVRDLMKTIDLRGRESAEFDVDFLLPDIEEEMENGEGVELEVNSDCRDVESTHAPTQPCKENREKRVSWKRLLSTLRKCYSRKVGDVKQNGLFNLSK